MQASALSSPLGARGLWPPFPEIALQASFRHPHTPHAVVAAASHAGGGRQIPQKVTPQGIIPPSWPGTLKIFLEVLGVGLEVSLGKARSLEERRTREKSRKGKGKVHWVKRFCSRPPDSEGPCRPQGSSLQHHLFLGGGAKDEETRLPRVPLPLSHSGSAFPLIDKSCGSLEMKSSGAYALCLQFGALPSGSEMIKWKEVMAFHLWEAGLRCCFPVCFCFPHQFHPFDCHVYSIIFIGS